MATTNFNKIVRGGNLNFKPWIAAKNTTEIVNGYVQKFYKQTPDNFKNDLKKPRPMAASKIQNEFPLRKFVPEKFTIPIISNKPTSKLRSNGYRSPPMTVKNSFIAPPKKLLKTPNFKIYARRRYASSISSSKSSFIRNKVNSNDEYRKKIYSPAQEFHYPTPRGTKDLLNTKYTETSKKLFNETYNRTKTSEVSKAICKNLMSIDELLKKKLCIVKQKPAIVEPLEIPKENVLKLSFKDCNHPSIEHFKKLTAIPYIKKPEKWSNRSSNLVLSSFELMPVKRNQFTGKVTKLRPTPRKTQTKLQSLQGSSHFNRFISKEATNKENNLDQSPSIINHQNIVASPRPFGEVYFRPNTTTISKEICNDLMAIDDVLKKKICVVKKPPIVEPPETPKKNVVKLSFNGWNHKSIEHYNKQIATPVVKKPEFGKEGTPNSGLSSFRLMSLKQKPFTGKVSKSSVTPRKARLQKLDSFHFKGSKVKFGSALKNESNIHKPFSFGSHGIGKSKFKSLQLAPSLEFGKSEQKFYDPQGAMEFLCLSQAQRGLRSGNQGSLLGNLRF
ncbi:uncharacterized protein LOC129905710 [Episyrphus balteatus]|uniref:uncharacterized protein LOC129905710 n=1 Tax=Episyrphus balteatus TaxID=286459 RepID=UPI002486A9E2|nr:uncharacterized protein LOC129905710 [Episyrphus balteatus]